jgi:hypothetical protein
MLCAAVNMSDQQGEATVLTGIAAGLLSGYIKQVQQAGTASHMMQMDATEYI